MNQPFTTALKLSTAIVVATQLFACDNGSSNGMGDGRSGNNLAMLTLAVTDAAVDGATEVNVQFTGVELKPATGSAIQYDFDTPMNINLLSLQGSLSQDFFNGIIIPAGEYNWVRLKVNAVPTVEDSYIKFSGDTKHELDIPSGSQTGLKLSGGFTLNANQHSNMTIDFDLRKSIVYSAGIYSLKPVLRLVNNNSATSLSGSIDSTYPEATSCSDSDPLTGNAVYLFSGFDATPDDIDGNPTEPVTSAVVNFNINTGNYEYELGFIPEGQYTLAFTCHSDLDTADGDETIPFDYVENVDTGPVISPDTSSISFNR